MVSEAFFLLGLTYRNLHINKSWLTNYLARITCLGIMSISLSETQNPGYEGIYPELLSPHLSPF